MSNLHWEPYLPGVVVVIVLAVVLIALLVVEWNKRQRYLWLRLTCLLLMTIALAGLVLNPVIVTEKESNALLLLTAGYDASAADSILSADRDVDIYQTPDAAVFPDANILSINELTQRHQEIKYILGQGLPSYVVDQFESRTYRFIPSGRLNGITSLQYPERFYANRWNAIRGVYHHAGAGEKYLRLSGPTGTEDSVRLVEGDQCLRLMFYPTAPGTFTYLLDDGDVREPLFLNILPEEKLSVILLNTFPTFEQRYLKNMLASRGHAVAVKSVVSRGRSRVEFANQPAFNIDPLRDDILRKTDLVILDAPAYKALSAAEQRAIQKNIEEGLGVIFLPDGTEGRKTAPMISWKTIRGADTVRVEVERVGKVTLPAIGAEPTGESEVLLTGDDGRILSGYQLKGAGKVGYTTLHETYQLGLQEKKDAYSGLWMPLLERVAREKEQEHELIVRTPFPWFEDEPISFDVISTTANIPLIEVDSITVPVRENSHLQQVWSGTVWLAGSGWHTLRAGDHETKLHLAPSTSWSALRVANQLKATAHLNANTAEAGTAMEVRSAGNLPWIFLLVFALAAGLLWLTPKL